MVRNGSFVWRGYPHRLFRAAHGILQSLTPYPGEQRVAMLPSVVRMLLTVFIEELTRTDSSPR